MTADRGQHQTVTEFGVAAQCLCHLCDSVLASGGVGQQVGKNDDPYRLAIDLRQVEVVFLDLYRPGVG